MSPHFETYPRIDGFGWRLKAANGEIIAQGEGHTTRHDAERAARTVIAAVLEIEEDYPFVGAIEVEQADG